MNSGMPQGWAGSRESDVRTSINGVIASYNNLIKSLVTDMQSQFVEGMADKWACNNAQSFFSGIFKPAIDNLTSSTTSTFSSVVASMNSAGASWAATEGGSFQSVAFTPSYAKVNVESIKENIGGVRGIDLNEANNVANRLSLIADAAKQALADAQQAVRNSGFLGGGQEEQLIDSLGTIKNEIDSATMTLAEETKRAIASTVQSYADTAGKIKQAFTVTQG